MGGFLGGAEGVFVWGERVAWGLCLLGERAGWTMWLGGCQGGKVGLWYGCGMNWHAGCSAVELCTLWDFP